MTFALEFDVDEETQRVMRVALMRYMTSLEDGLGRGEGYALHAAQVGAAILATDQPWGVLGESGVAVITDALRHEIDEGRPGNAAKAQEIIEKVDERFRDLFRNLPPGAII